MLFDVGLCCLMLVCVGLVLVCVGLCWFITSLTMVDSRSIDICSYTMMILKQQRELSPSLDPLPAFRAVAAIFLSRSQHHGSFLRAQNKERLMGGTRFFGLVVGQIVCCSEHVISCEKISLLCGSIPPLSGSFMEVPFQNTDTYCFEEEIDMQRPATFVVSI